MKSLVGFKVSQEEKFARAAGARGMTMTDFLKEAAWRMLADDTVVVLPLEVAADKKAAGT